MSKPKLKVALHTCHPEFKTPGKTFWLEDGELRGRTTGETVKAEIELHEVGGADELAELIRQASPGQYLTGGIPDHDKCLCFSNGQLVKSLANIGQEPFTDNGMPIVTRTETELPYSNGPGILVVDNDGEADIEQVFKDTLPHLLDQKRVHKPSSSANIFGEDGNELRGLTGTHTLFPVLDGSDVPRALEVLHKRAILAGYNNFYVGESGQFLERSPADLAMRISCQPIFLHAKVEGKLNQRMKVEVRGSVEFLDTAEAIPDLTPEEKRTYMQLMADKRDELKLEARRKRSAWLDARVDEIKARGHDETEARKAVISALRGRILPPEFELRLAGGQRVTVQDVLEHPDKYHGVNCRDPLEPEYGGDGVAIIYTDRTPLVHSKSHGVGKTYRMTNQRLDNAPGLSEKEVFKELEADYDRQTDRLRSGKLGPEKGWEIMLNASVTTKEHTDKAKAAEPLVRTPLVPVMRGQLTFFYGFPGCGKTAMAMELCSLAAEAGYEPHYFQLDAPVADLAIYREKAEEAGFKLHSTLADGVNKEALLKTLKAMAEQGTIDDLNNMVVVLDTYKKFQGNVNSKQGNSELLGELLRSLTLKGCTVVVLGHTIKRRGDDGLPVWAGTQDIEDECDALWCLDHARSDDGKQIHTNVHHKKGRHTHDQNWAFTVFRGSSLAGNTVDMSAEFDPELQVLEQLESLRNRESGTIQLIREVLRTVPDLNQSETVERVRQRATSTGADVPGKNRIRMLLKTLDGHEWVSVVCPSENNATRYRLGSATEDLMSQGRGTGLPPRESENRASPGNL